MTPSSPEVPEPCALIFGGDNGHMGTRFPQAPVTCQLVGAPGIVFLGLAAQALDTGCELLVN